MGEPSLVSVVDDDESVRESLPHLVREFGYAVQAFASAEEFLASDCVGKTTSPCRAYLGPTCNGNWSVRAMRYRSSSSLLTETRRSGRECLNRAPWSACTSHSPMRP